MNGCVVLPHAAAPGVETRPLVLHVVYRFDVGGLENGVVNLINRMAPGAYRHGVVALTEITDFRRRIFRDDVSFHALDKPPGHAWQLYPRLYRLFRTLRPAVIHSRNLAALEVTAPAWAAGVPVRIHGEHGRDVGDLNGDSRKYQWVRRFYSPFTSQFVALSGDLERYLTGPVGIAGRRVAQIYNGVDSERFYPAGGQRQPIEGCPFVEDGLWLIGTVGRMAEVKDQLTLVQAFVEACRDDALRQRLRLVLVGDGPLRAACDALLSQSGLRDLAWLPGNRDDVPAILRGLDCFVLPSLAEGISNTILEAMACGLPVVATDVGGNGELVVAGQTGELCPAADPLAMAMAIQRYAGQPEVARAAGRAGRRRVEQEFSLDAMVDAYRRLYDALLQRSGVAGGKT